MAKKRVEPFNPWPSFVDLFASVIMVVLMFMLILIVNITYYAQFKYKVSYTGTVAINQTVSKPAIIPKPVIIPSPVSVPKQIIREEKHEQEKYTQEKKESVVGEKAIEIVDDNITKELEAVAGINLSMTSNNFERQDNVFYEDWMVVKYLDSEVILDPKSIKDIDKFLLHVKKKFPKHTVWIYIKEPQNQISASVGKQIALSRILNIRNLLRKRDYKNEDVEIKFRENIPVKNTTDHASGYAVITIQRKK